MFTFNPGQEEDQLTHTDPFRSTADTVFDDNNKNMESPGLGNKEKPVHLKHHSFSDTGVQ